MFTIEEYQNKYGKYNTSLAHELLYGLSQIKIAVHHVVDTAVKSIKGPNLVMKVMQTAIKALMYVPILASHLTEAKLLLKEIKDCTNFIKGMQSIDGLINFKFAWKLIILNVSGLVLFVLTTITLSEKFLIDCSAIKTTLTAIPVLGKLPFGGLLHISLIGLIGSLLLLSLDKKKKLEQTTSKINSRIEFWNNPIDLNKVLNLDLKYEVKILDLQKYIALKKEQLVDGKEAEKNSGTQFNKKILKIHQKSLATLNNNINKKKKELSALEKKKHQWEYLKKNFKEINQEQLQEYQKAKLHNWKNKLDKLNIEKKSNVLIITNNAISIAKNFIVVATIITGIGLAILPIAVLGLSIISCFISVTNYFIKKSVNQIEINSIDMTHYLSISCINCNS